MKKENWSICRLINYTDVWGNKKDGYEINNQCIEFDDLHILDTEMTHKKILTYLKNTGFLTTDDMRRFTIIDRGDLIEIYVKKDSYPLCRLEVIESYDNWRK